MRKSEPSAQKTPDSTPGGRFGGVFRTATFRLTVGLVCVIVVGMGLQFGLLYGQLNRFERHRTRELLFSSAEILAQEPPQELAVKLRDRSTNELRVILNGAGLFELSRQYVAGDIKHWPVGLQPPPEDYSLHSPKIQPLVVRLPDGTNALMCFLVVRVAGPAGTVRYLVVERSRHMSDELRRLVSKAAMYSVVPVVLFALLAGLFLSQRALARIKAVHEALERIMKGNLRERLPVDGGGDDLQLLGRAVNRMLDRLEQLMNEIKDVGNNIAHDLRTPLARVQARLERASSLLSVLPPGQEAQFEDVLVRSKLDLEQCFSVITAILRIGEIESGQRRAGFALMTLQPLVTDIADLYEPMAETKGISLSVELPEKPLGFYGDADLLNEVLANLLDNALKFTPEGGRVELRGGLREEGGCWLEVRDTGSGIPECEREAVLGRFYRADKSRHIPGSGLGLSLVAAIVRLHDARLEIEDNMSEHAPVGVAENADNGEKRASSSHSVVSQPVSTTAGNGRGAVMRIVFLSRDRLGGKETSR